MRQAEKERTILGPNSAHTQPGGENSKKKNIKKIPKITKQLSFIIFSQNGMRLEDIGRERDKRIMDPNSARTRSEGENSEKNSKKIKKKN